MVCLLDDSSFFVNVGRCYHILLNTHFIRWIQGDHYILHHGGLPTNRKTRTRLHFVSMCHFHQMGYFLPCKYQGPTPKANFPCYLYKHLETWKSCTHQCNQHWYSCQTLQHVTYGRMMHLLYPHLYHCAI